MTHDEAVKKVYELTPQLREYDEFMYLGVRWLPYCMYFHHNNYRSDVINTDSFGFRLTSYGDSFVSTDNFPIERPVNIVIGGSTAMGTGVTSDSKTVASILHEKTGEVWLNFGARGYNATQELTLFMLHMHRFKKIDNIVILSGLNSLTLEGLPDEYGSELGKYYYSYEFNTYMNKYNEDLKRKKDVYASALDGDERGLISKLKDRLNEWIDKQNPAEYVINDEHVSLADRIEHAAFHTAESAKYIKRLTAHMDTNVSFYLQPLSRWTKDKFHDKEEEMFKAIDACANNFWRLFEKLCHKNLHQDYVKAISDCISDEKISFFDMNEILRGSCSIKENVYVDHLHFNDLGYREMATCIHNSLLDSRRNVA